MRTIRRVGMALAVVMLAVWSYALACRRDTMQMGAGVDPGTPWPADTWERGGTDPSVVLGRLPASEFCEVTAARQLEAQSRLTERAWDVLTAEETDRYSGGKLRAPKEGGVAVLLRCVQASPHPDDHSDRDETQVLGNAGYVLVRFTTLRA